MRPEMGTDGTAACKQHVAGKNGFNVVQCPLGSTATAWKNGLATGFECVNPNAPNPQNMTWTAITEYGDEPKPDKYWMGWSDQGKCDLREKKDGKDPYCTCGGGMRPEMGTDGTAACK